MKQDRHSEQRSLINTMRGDYRDALLAGITDEQAYDALFTTLTKQYADGNLPVPELLKLVAFAVRRMAIKRLADKHAREHPLPLHTEN